jgi:hypothetical protein
MPLSAENRDTSWQEAGGVVGSPKLPVWRGVQAVEGFSTLVPFSIHRSATNVVSEQFWGRAARAFLTRKSRDACFIFRVIFDPSFTRLSSRSQQINVKSE